MVKTVTNPDKCLACGGLIAQRNPTGSCDHLYWPENLTPKAKIANHIRADHTQSLTFREEKIINGLRFDAGEYILVRLGPSAQEPNF